MKFCVIADPHLGYRQHALEERRDDFLYALWECAEQAIKVQAGFVIIAGDLFHTRSPDWYDIDCAMDIFRMLNNCCIEVVAIRGNHDAPSYTDRIGWDDLFRKLGLIHELPYQWMNWSRDTKYFNVHGLNWSTDINQALREYDIYPHNNKQFNILVLHGGIDNMLYHDKAQVSMETLNSLKDKFNMIFLGHIHKPYNIGNWIYSPGSLENVSVAETQWPERGMLIVDVAEDFSYTVETYVPKRRTINSWVMGINSINDWLNYDLAYNDENAMIFVTLVGEVDNPLTTEYLSQLEKQIKEKSRGIFVKIKNHTTLPNEPSHLGEEISVDKAYNFVFGDKAEIAKSIKDDLTNRRKLNLENL